MGEMNQEQKIIFVKTEIKLDENDYESIREEFIPDADMLHFPENTEGLTIYPLSITSYPRVLASLTAKSAGEWAIRKCIHENWEITYGNIQCCLANLEMDF